MTSNTTSPRAHRFAVVIGRLQPAHNGHQTLIDTALKTADKVIVILGSAFQARDPKNPFTWTERANFVRAMVSEQDRERLLFAGVRDFHDDNQWVQTVSAEVARLSGDDNDVALVGHFKDSSSYYLRRFPRWTLVEVTREVELDATALRRVMFEGDDFDAAATVLSEYVCPGVLALLRCYAQLPWFEKVRKEHRAVVTYKKRWPGPIHVTVDAVVKAQDKVLLIRRGGEIGNGLWAVPGGFLEPEEGLFTGALRELKEETTLSQFPSTWDHAFRGSQVFSYPQRSLRGRIITHAYFFDLGDVREVPEVRAEDDAKHAEWVPISKLQEMEEAFFEDHYLILRHFLKF